MNTKARLLASAVLIALLPGCGGGSAADVAKKFWSAVNDGNLEKAKSYATRATAETLTIDNTAGDSNVDVEFGETTVEGERTIIETHMVARMGDVNQTVEMKTVLIQEDGKWKVDVMSTMMSMFGGAAGQMMQEMTEAMGEAMGQAMEGMGEAMMEGMQKSFSQFGASGLSTLPNTGSDALPKARDYQIKFGYMKKKQDGTHYVYKETTKIPMRTRNFKWGYTIEAEGDPFTTYSIAYSPDGPMGGDAYPRTNSKGEQGWESNINTVTHGRFTRAYRNDPGDTPGERKIEIYIENKLAKTIDFKIGNP